MMDGPKLTGTGAAYLRVSDDRQETERQIASVRNFLQRHAVKVDERNWFEDDMPRDLSDKRQDFQRMLREVQAGRLAWIVVERIERFGFADEWELVELVRDLRKAGCKLYDTRGDDWTAAGLMSFFKVGLAGHSSHNEQVQKSWRVLGGMAVKARAGEWMGGPPRLGFDVACYDRASGAELWRVVYEGRDQVGSEKRRGKQRPVYSIRRLKVYPDGRSERLDGNVVFRQSKDTQVMRITPSRDAVKLEAARGVFRRYASEAVSFFDLARWLNGQGVRNSFGQTFQSNDVRKMLSDEAYLGYPTFAKRRAGRFHRIAAGAVAELEPGLKGKDTASGAEDMVKASVRLFDPVIDRATWDAVQKKLAARATKTHTPKKPGLYLAGLVVCHGCGRPMTARADRMEYYCGTWDKHRTRGTLADSPCLRNGVRHADLEGHVERYLEEVGKRLDLLVSCPDTHRLTDRLDQQAGEAWQAFRGGLERLTDYLREHRPEEYLEILREDEAQQAADRRAVADAADDPPAPPGTLAAHLGHQVLADACEKAGSGHAQPEYGDFVWRCLEAYRRHFDPTGLAADIAKLEGEHTAMMHRYADLPTPRAKEKAKAELAELEARIGELEAQREDVADVVRVSLQQMADLRAAAAEARREMRAEAGAQALRRRAEALRGLLCRIECEFVVTGRARPCKGGAGSRLVSVGFLPVAGDAVRLPAAGGFRLQGKPCNAYPPLFRLLAVRFPA